VESTSLHRVNEGGVLTFIDDSELARVQHLMYWCDECNAYHIRDASAKMGEWYSLLNQEVLDNA
jgi:hypothetical protein